MPGVTRAVSAFATRPRGDAPAAANGDAVATAVLDTVGVAIAGQRTDGPRIAGEWVASVSPPGEVPVWGSGARVSAPDAALLNGTAAHALDWDDVSPAMPIHPSAVLVPALLAQASLTDVAGGALVHAYNVGAAVFRAVSEALPVNASVRRGWHNTATSGRIAAVAALASLTGATADATAHALGLAASMAGGSVSNFGTMTKPLHAGLAARDALTALGLATRGFTSNPRQLEDPAGFFAMHGEPDPARLAVLAERLDHWERNWPRDWSLKRHPCCYGTHHAADAALELRGSFDTGDVRAIDVSIYEPDAGILTKGKPVTGLEAKFSLEYVVAAALVRGELTLPDFEAKALADPAVDALMDKVRWTGDPAEPARYADLRVTLTDGRELRVRTDITRGDARDPMTADEVRGKFVSACSSAGWTRTRAARAADELTAVTSSGTAGLGAVLADPGPQEGNR